MPEFEAGGSADRAVPAFRVGEWLVQPSLDRVSRPGETHRLEPKVMDVLVLLAHRGGVVAHGDILAAVWAKKFMARTVVPRAIAELRRVLGDVAHAPRYIETIPKRGYRLIAPVLPADGDGASEARAIEAPLPRPKWEAARTAVTGPPSASRPRYASWLLVFASTIVCVVGVVGGVIARLGEVPGVSAGRGARATRALAVLPFSNASGDPRQEYLAAGLTEALVTNLLRTRALRVTTLASALRYRDTAKPPSEIARELHVDAVLEGTLEPGSNRVHITARLIDGASNGVLWTATYDRDLRDALDLQEDVATTIAREVQARLAPARRTVPAETSGSGSTQRLLTYR